VARNEQHALVRFENGLGAIAVVHVEISDRHALQAVCRQRMRGSDCDAVEHAEAHRLIACSVVARRAHGAEGALPVVRVHHRVDGGHYGTGSAQGGVERTG
jgi:hypothetical protein